jgi:hypothetical protein
MPPWCFFSLTHMLILMWFESIRKFTPHAAYFDTFDMTASYYSPLCFWLQNYWSQVWASREDANGADGNVKYLLASSSHNPLCKRQASASSSPIEKTQTLILGSSCCSERYRQKTKYTESVDHKLCNISSSGRRRRRCTWGESSEPWNSSNTPCSSS